MPLTPEEKAELDLLKQKKQQSIGEANGNTAGIAEKVGKNLGGFVTGLSIGTAENINPLNIPRGLETIGRGAGITAGKLATGEGFHPFTSISEAAKGPFITPDLSLRKVAPAIRAGVQAPFSLRTFSQILKEEQSAQDVIQGNPAVEAGELTANLGGAAVGLGQLAIQASKKLPKFVEKLTTLRGLKTIEQAPTEISGISRQQLLKAKDLQRQLLGDLAPEMEKALFENTKAVRELVQGPQEGRSVLSSVENMRKQLMTNKQILGDSIGEFRYAIVSDAPQKFDTSLAIKSLNEFKRQRALSGGKSILDPREANELENIRGLLVNPSKGEQIRELTTRDATLVVDKLDDYLTKQGFYEGKNVTKTNQYLLELRNSIDEELAALYPAYKELKGRYKDFIDDYQSIQNKIEGLGAESFAANLFGRNKTETRELVERLMNKGDDTAKAFKQAVMDAKNISSINQKYNTALADLKTKADGIKFQSGKDLMNEIANKAMARKLSEISDKDADILRNLINQYTQSKVESAEKAVKTIETLAGGVGGSIGAWLGYKMGQPTIGALAGGYIAGKGAGLLKRAAQGDVRGKALKEAEGMFSIERLLDEVQKVKTVSPETRGLAKNIQWINKKFGPEAAEAFLNKVNLTSNFKNDFEKVISAMGVIQGPLQYIMEFEGSEIRPSKQLMRKKEK